MQNDAKCFCPNLSTTLWITLKDPICSEISEHVSEHTSPINMDMTPSLLRLHELFIIKDDGLHWRIQVPGEHLRSAPTGVWVNVDGVVCGRDYLLNAMLPKGMDMHRGKFRVRKMIKGHKHIFLSESFDAANDMLSNLNASA